MAELMQVASRTALHPVTRTEERTRNQFLTFALGGEVMAMEIRFSKEILQYGGLTEVPLMPPAVRGVINLRGAVVPVIDLAVRLGRRPQQVDRHTCIVILDVEENGDGMVMGIVVDQVKEVLEIADTEIDPAPAFGSNLRPEFIQGVGKVRGQFILLLDINRVLSIEEIGSLSLGHPGSTD